jgi:ZU5 domain
MQLANKNDAILRCFVVGFVVIGVMSACGDDHAAVSNQLASNVKQQDVSARRTTHRTTHDHVTEVGNRVDARQIGGSQNSALDSAQATLPSRTTLPHLSETTSSVVMKDVASASGKIGSNGGTIEITDKHSPIYGAKIVVPKGAIANGVVTLTLGYEDRLPTPMHPEAVKAGLIVVSKTIVVRQDREGSFQKPIEITIPYHAKRIQMPPLVLVWQDDFKSFNAVNKDLHLKDNHLTAYAVFSGKFVVTGFDRPLWQFKSKRK